MSRAPVRFVGDPTSSNDAVVGFHALDDQQRRPQRFGQPTLIDPNETLCGFELSGHYQA